MERNTIEHTALTTTTVDENTAIKLPVPDPAICTGGIREVSAIENYKC